MTWTLLCALSFVIFINRYFFLDPRIKVVLPKLMVKMLKYSAPCLLTALCAPMVFFEGDQLRVLPFNIYLISAVICVILAISHQKILVNLLLALFCFYTLNYFFG
jgi:branched-subunit amino acid transport protein